MPQYPPHLTDGSGRRVFERQPGLYAVRQPAGASVDAEAVAVIPDDAQVCFAVYREGGAPRAADGLVTPVYAAGDGGPLAIPTGRIFVRLTDGVRADERGRQFRSAGFEIDQTPAYAPNAAWLRPTQGGIERALPALDALRALADVVHVEPQMLMQRASKGG